MLLKNKIISLLFLILIIGTPNVLYSMDKRQEEATLKTLMDKHKKYKEKIAMQKAKIEHAAQQKMDEEDEQRRVQNLNDKREFEIQLEKEKITLERAKQREPFIKYEEAEAAKKINAETEARSRLNKENLETEAFKQAQQATQSAINGNDATRQIGIQAVNNFTKGMSTALGNSVSGSFVNAVQKELEYLYSQYRPTQIALLQEVEAASRIIHQGIANVEGYYEKQLKLILSSQNKDPKVINEEVQALKAEVYQAYADLDAMEKESRDRLRQSYNFRNPNFGRTAQEPKKNIFEEPKTPAHHNENSPTQPQNNGNTKNTSKSFIKNAASLIATAPILFADKIVNAFSIDSHVNQLTQLEPLKTDWTITHTKEISRVAALSLFVATGALLYKSYSWYYNQDRITAGETVLQLEEQKEQVALQFAKEMEKATLSKEDKQKLQIAYNNYMKELQDEIDEQKSIAGYAVSKKLFIGALIASSGIAGLIAYLKHYLETAQTTILPEQNTHIYKTHDAPMVQASSTILPKKPTAIILPQPEQVILPEPRKTETVLQEPNLPVEPQNSEIKTKIDEIIQPAEAINNDQAQIPNKQPVNETGTKLKKPLMGRP